MKVFVQGKGPASLTKNDFLAAGGQGQVFAKGSLAYKIYDDPSKMIPVAKIGELAAITEPKVIKPEDVLLDDKGKPIGYTMRFVRDTYTLCQIFTKAFRQRTNLTPDLMLALVRDLQATVKTVHSRGVLIVDLNEMNFLVNHGLSEVYAIDVDSWQTKSFHAAALMESVRDRHSKPNHFSELTDWFAFAIVSFQMLIGIHPYKGRHPKFGDDMDARMTHNLSVLNPEVAFPKAVVQSFNVIPEVYLRWYEAVLERGQRLAPPEDLVASIPQFTTARLVPAIGGAIEITKLFELPGDIVDFFDWAGNPVTFTETEVYLGDRWVINAFPGAVVGFSPKMSRPILAAIHAERLWLYDLMGKRSVPLDIAAKAVMVSNDRIYAVSATSIIEVRFFETATTVMAAPVVVGSCLELSTKAYDGVILQDLLGSYYGSFFPKSETHHQIRLRELDGYRIVDAKSSGPVLMVVASKSGKYDRFVYRFSADYANHDLRKIHDITPTGLNFVTLPSGVCVQIDEEGDVRVFSSKIGSAAEKIITEPAVADMKLVVRGAQLIGLRGHEAFSLRMK